MASAHISTPVRATRAKGHMDSRAVTDNSNSNRATTSSVPTPNRNTEVATSLNSSLRRRRGVMHGSMPQVERLVSSAVQS